METEEKLDERTLRKELELVRTSGKLYRALDLDALDAESRRVLAAALDYLPLPERNIGNARVETVLRQFGSGPFATDALLDAFACALPAENALRMAIRTCSIDFGSADKSRRDAVRKRLALIFLATRSH